MTTPAETIERLRRIEASAAEDRPLGEDGRWLAERLRVFLRPRIDLSFEDCVGLHGETGKATWRAALRRRERDDALRRFAAATYPTLRGRGLHIAMAEAIKAYATRSWPRDRAGGGVPAVHRDTPRADLFQAFLLGDGRIPFSRNALAIVLDTECPVKPAASLNEAGPIVTPGREWEAG